MVSIPGEPYEVRCPLHGSIPFNERERAIIDHPYCQRLRSISQLGFAHLVYPGATHTRFSHVLGVMHLAGRVFDHVVAAAPALWRDYGPGAVAYCRQVVRLAGLLHDLGHLPFSHSFEPLCPPKGRLPLPRDWFARLDPAARARHEDYSVALVHALARESPPLLEAEEARDIASLIHDDVTPSPRLAGLSGGEASRDLHPLLKEIISGEIDADRMDYLQRDAHFAGVAYGFFDRERLIRALTCLPTERGVSLALDFNALFTYENFLMARFHMAMQVYFHQTLLPFDHFLQQAVRTGEVAFDLERGLEGILEAREDIILARLFAARHRPWAARIVHRRPAARLYRLDGTGDEALRRRILEALRGAGIAPIHVREQRRLSSLAERERAGHPPLYVLESVLGRERPRPLTEASQLLRHYNQVFVIERVYCDPEERPRAMEVLHRALEGEG